MRPSISEDAPLHPFEVVRAVLDTRTDRSSLMERLSRHPPDPFVLLRYAGDCAVICALAAAVRERGLSDALQPELVEALDTVLEANRERNARIVEATERYVAILAGAGIVPVALKGVGVILEALHGDPGARMASDIDLLVPPDALSDALVALRDAGCLQVGNKYDPRHRGNAPGEAPVDPADFRNDPRHAFYHVPAIRHPSLYVNLELHTGVSSPTMPMGAWLNEAVRVGTRPLRVPHRSTSALPGGAVLLPAPPARLLHNFHHSQIKDRLGALGAIDWRHLLDARALIERSDDPALVRTLRERAVAEGLGAELELHFWQLRELLGVPLPDVTSSAAARRRIARFERQLRSRRRRQLATLEHFWRRRTRDLLSPDQLRRYYGPLPYPVAVARAVHFRGANAIRLVRSGNLRRLATGR